MPSFQIAVDPHRRAAAKLVRQVRTKLQALALESKAERGISQSEVARRIGVHRSVIHRELKGTSPISLGRVAEIAWAYGKEAVFDLQEPKKTSDNMKTESHPLDAPKVVSIRDMNNDATFSREAA
jgi:transcriptional regulator with XRE-family HTH domain